MTYIAKPKMRQGRPAKLDEATTLKQTEVLEATHTRFYAIIVRETASLIPAGKERATELNKRTAYARVAVSRLRSYAKSGGDLTALVPARVTRDTIRVKSATPRAVSSGRLKQRAERESKSLMATLIGLADTDKASAVSEMQLLIGQLANQLVQLGVATSTKDVEQAARDHIPLRVGRTLFIPTESQVIRAKEMPA